MNSSALFACQRFPRSSAYHPDWIMAGVSGGANPLWMTEWLAGALDLRPGMRVLDLGCGRALSSIFLHREFGVQVWAVDLWFSATENAQRIRDAGAADGVFPLRANARALPFARDFFDCIVSVDSFPYYGTDEMYLPSLARHVKPGGQIGIAGAGLVREIDGPVPEPLRAWWTPDLGALHSPGWWRRHWEKSGILSVETADSLPEGWQLWRDWLRTIAPANEVEIAALEADRGGYLGYSRAVGRRDGNVELPESDITIPAEYAKRPLLKGADSP